jgi:hypothetical protein
VKRFIVRTLVAATAVVTGITALTVRTPVRQARWLAEYDSTKHYLATADANFDWIVGKKHLDLPALDSTTRDRVARSWSSLGAAWTVRSFVRQFDDGHTRARIRPALWWQGVREMTSRPASVSAVSASDYEPTPVAPELHASMSAAEACSAAGLDISARPDGWALPFPDAVGAVLVPDSEFPAVIIPVSGGQRIGILRVANFGHEHFGPSCERAWAKYSAPLPVPCSGDCVGRLEAAVIRDIASRAAEVARELERRGAVAVVVDITGNGGGSELADAMARALTVRQLHIASGGFIRHPLYAGIFTEMRDAITSDTARATPEQRALIGRAELRLDSLIAEGGRDCHHDVVWRGGTPDCSNTVVAPPLVSYLPPGALAELPNGWVIWPPAWYDSAEGLFRGRLLVLQDHHSASASEEFAARLRDNDAALIIGGRSYGAGCGYSNGGTSLELPALGLLVRAPDCQRLRMDGTNETAGIAPDVDAGWTADDNGADSVRKAIGAIARAFDKE